ncbi:MAG: photosystem II stability/assembly factor-like uncharacterized protein [Polaribacter sp.]|jgi:photosystem II stability/assembly factor-like uncharacterized protein
MNKPSTYGFLLKITLISILLMGQSIGLLAQWEAVYFDSSNTPDNFPNIKTVEFTSLQNGLAAGDNGLVYRSSDSGLNWESILTEPNGLRFVDMNFATPITAFCVAQENNVSNSCDGSGVIARTKNYGATWNFTYTDDNLFAVHFPTESVGYAVGSCDAVYKTINGGDSWELFNPGSGSGFTNVFFRDELNGFVAGLGDVFYQTIDGGENWINIDLPNASDYTEITFVDATVGFVLAGNKVFKTSDGGFDWTEEITIPDPGALNYTTMFWVDENKAWIATDSRLRNTDDGGSSWLLQEANTPSNNNAFTFGIQDLFFLNENQGFIAGTQGYFKTITGGASLPDLQYLAGNVFIDLDENCNLDVSDSSLKTWVIEITDGTNKFFSTTDFNGNYFLALPTGEYDVQLALPNKNWTNGCQLTYQITLDAPLDTLIRNLPVRKAVDNCPVLEVDISTNALAHCSDNIYTVRYFNRGTATANASYVDVKLEESLTMTSTNWSSVSGNTYTFDLGDVAEGESGSLSFVAFLECNPIVGQTHAVQANIYPDGFCLPASPLWDGASLSITLECTGDSVAFTITNTGTGDMQSLQDFAIIEDHIIFMTGPIDLDADQDSTFTLYPQGTTLRLEVDQVSNHPGRSNPSASYEACTTNNSGGISTGYVTQFPEDDANVFVSIDAQESTASAVTTNKRAYPKGYGDEHYIEANVDLDYHILFENNTTETVYTVIVQDTLSQWFNASSIRQGSSNYEYDFSLSGNGMATFTFSDLELAPGEKGFIKFRVQQKVDNPNGTFIENTACISFDYGLNNKTNTTVHQVSSDFLETADFIQITGNIANENGEAIALVDVQHNGQSGIETDNNGYFAIDDVSPMTPYTVTPYKNINLTNGVDAADLYLIQQHLLENEILDSEYKMLAADVNNSGSITTLDVFQVRAAVLLLTDEFPNNTSWRFVKTPYDFEDASKPFNSVFPEAFTFGIPLSENEINFTGVKVGDVDESHDPLSLTGEEAEPREKKALIVEDLALENGVSYEVPVYIEAGDDLAALQLALELDEEALHFEGIETDTHTICRSDNFGYRFLRAGVITACWFDQNAVESNQPNQSALTTLFRLRFTAKKKGKLSSYLTLNPELVDGRAYERKDDLLTKELKRKLIYLQFNAPGQSPTIVSLPALEIFPNPTSNNDLYIKYTLTEDSNIKITIYNALGQIVKKILFPERRAKGSYTYKWNTAGLGEGSYFIQLQTNTGSPELRKFVKIGG